MTIGMRIFMTLMLLACFGLMWGAGLVHGQLMCAAP